MFFFIFAVNSSSLQAADKTVVKIAYLPITHAYPLYVEKELLSSDLKNTDIELVRFGSWPELVEALNAGKVDGASVLFPLAVKAKEKGINIKAVALGHRDGNVFIVSPEIKSINELKGKTVAIPSKLSSHYILLFQALKSANLSLKDVNIVELAPPEMPAALAEKRISGYLVAEPFGAKAVALGIGKVLLKSEDIWKNSLCCALVLRSDFINGKSSNVKELVAGYIKGADKIVSGDNEAKEAGKKYIKVDGKVLELSLGWISYKNLKISEKEYNTLRNYMKEIGVSENPPLYKDLVDNSLLPVKK